MVPRLSSIGTPVAIRMFTSTLGSWRTRRAQRAPIYKILEIQGIAMQSRPHFNGNELALFNLSSPKVKHQGTLRADDFVKTSPLLQRCTPPTAGACAPPYRGSQSAFLHGPTWRPSHNNLPRTRAPGRNTPHPLERRGITEYLELWSRECLSTQHTWRKPGWWCWMELASKNLM